MTSLIINRLQIKYRDKETLIATRTPIAIPSIFRSKDLSFGPHSAANSVSQSHMQEYELDRTARTHSAREHVQVKVKVKFTLEQATKAQRGSRGIALLFL
jgi:hypothetical protein